MVSSLTNVALPSFPKTAPPCSERDKNSLAPRATQSSDGSPERFSKPTTAYRGAGPWSFWPHAEKSAASRHGISNLCGAGGFACLVRARPSSGKLSNVLTARRRAVAEMQVANAVARRFPHVETRSPLKNTRLQRHDFEELRFLQHAGKFRRTPDFVLVLETLFKRSAEVLQSHIVFAEFCV